MFSLIISLLSPSWRNHSIRPQRDPKRWCCIYRNTTLKYVTCEPGKALVLADTLSWAFLDWQPNRKLHGACPGNQVPVTQRSLDLLHEEMESDEVPSALRNVVLTGLSNENSDFPDLFMPYILYRDEITAHHGLLWRGGRVIDSHSMRAEVPTMTPANPKNHWCLDHGIPDRPWQTVGIDLLAINGIDCMVTSDNYSNFWEVDRLYNTDVPIVIRKLSHFTRSGISQTAVNDNGPKFSSGELTEFAHEWDFDYNPARLRHLLDFFRTSRPTPGT